MKAKNVIMQNIQRRKTTKTKLLAIKNMRTMRKKLNRKVGRPS